MTELANRQEDDARTKWSRIAVRMISALGAFAQVCAVYRMNGGEAAGLSAFLLLFFAWSLSPFVIASLVIRRANVGIFRTVGLAAASGFGLLVYAQLCLQRETSSTAGLAFIFIPLWQLVGMTIVLLATKRWRKK